MASLHQNNSLATSEWGRCRYLDSWENRATRLRGMERELLEGQILPKSSSSNGKVGGNDTRKGPIVFEQTNKQTNNYSDIRAKTFVQSLTSSFFSTVSHELGYIRMTGCHFMSRKKRGDVWKEKFISLETSFPHDIRYVACLSSGLGDDIKWLCKNRQNRKTDRKRQQDQFLFHRPPRPKPSKNTLLFYLSRKTSIGGF